MEAIHRAIVEGAPDAILFADAEGTIRLWNRGAERVFGHPAAEALGQSLDLIIPERLRARHWEGYFRAMASGETSYGTKLLAVPALHRDGRQLSCEFSIVLVKDEEGRVQGVASIVRDVTLRWEQERALRGRLAVLERGGERLSPADE